MRFMGHITVVIFGGKKGMKQGEKKKEFCHGV